MKPMSWSRQTVTLFILPCLVLALVCVFGLSAASAPATADSTAQPPEAHPPVSNMAEIELAATPQNLALLEQMGAATRPAAASGNVLVDLNGEQQGVLKRHGVEYQVIRPFVLARGSGQPGLTYPFVSGNNDTNVNIPDSDGFVYSDILISGIPAGNYVAAVDVHYIIRHTYIGDLYIDMVNPGGTYFQVLSNRQYGSQDDLDRWESNLSGWNGQEGNGTWRLWVQDQAGADVGYIDFWEVRVYYGTVPTPTPTPTCGLSLPSPYVARVNAGGANYTDGGGQTWLADTLYAHCTWPYWGATGGQTYTTTHGIDGTSDDALYQSQRFFLETNGYLFIVPVGVFQVDMKFSEIYPSIRAGERVFDIRAEGQTVIHALDVFALSGGLYRTHDLSFTVAVTDGQLNINFVRYRDKDAPFVSAIKVTQTSSQLPTPTHTPQVTVTTTPPSGSNTLDAPCQIDSYTSDGNPVANYGSATELYAGYQRRLRTWVKCDVSYVPTNATVFQATLKLYYLGEPGGDVSIDVFHLHNDWQENTITHNNQPPYDPTAIANHWVARPNPVYIDFDITGMVQQWVNGSHPNMGVMLTDHNDNNSARFASSENGINKPPYIRVTYGGPTHTPTPTITLPPSGATMYLSPATGSYGIGQLFTVDIMVNAGAQPVDGAQAFINFNPAYLTVVDAAGNPTNQIIPGSAFSSHLLNSVDNAAGQISYSDGQLTGSPISGLFTLATIRFKANSAVASTAVDFSMSAPRQTKLTYMGNNVLGSVSGGSYQITTGAVLAGAIRIQGRPNPPNSLLAVPLVVKFYSPGGSTPIITRNVTADSNGAFTVSGIPAGTYDITVKNAQTLTNKKTALSLSGTTNVNFGTLLTGDANDDDIVDISDFSILRTTFLKACGGAGFDTRADFNGDCIVDISDFSLLRTNFLRAGPVIVSLGN